MLTPQEQQAVMQTVKRIVSQDRARRKKVERQVIHPRTAKQAEERDLETLADMLKEMG